MRVHKKTEGYMMFLEMPDDWKTPTAGEFEKAKSHALAALALPQLARYYDNSRNYAGTTFWSLGSNPTGDAVPDDLLAVTLLSVQVGPHGVRALIEDGDDRRAVLNALAKVSTTRTLAEATSQDLIAAWELHSVVKKAISNPQA